MIHDKLENWKLYFSSPSWETVFAYLQSLSAETELVEKVQLQGEKIYARVMRYPTCTANESVLETHDEYVDIQMSLSGCEAIEWFDRSTLQVKTPYNSELDFTLYHLPATSCLHVNNFPGYFTVLFPEDAHMPMLRVFDEGGEVKKVVVKIHRSLV
nr:YhcH/YjgK/YiaL family protein [uncultured Desulfobulbus sp.]